MKCADPVKDCPITTTFLGEHGAILKSIERIEKALTNGHGIEQRLQNLEVWQGQLDGVKTAIHDLKTAHDERKGAMKLMKVFLVIVGLIPIGIELLRVVGRIP